MWFFFVYQFALKYFQNCDGKLENIVSAVRNIFIFYLTHANCVYFNAAHDGSGMSYTGHTPGTSLRMSRSARLHLVRKINLKSGWLNWIQIVNPELSERVKIYQNIEILRILEMDEGMVLSVILCPMIHSLNLMTILYII